MTLLQDVATRLAGKRVCVTGGAGFIGSHIVDALVSGGANVKIIDDLSNGRESNCAHHGDAIDLIRASILEDDALTLATADAEIVLHLAAIGSVPRSVEEPVLYHAVNATGTLRVLEAARKARVRRIVYAASSSAYGDSTNFPLEESRPPAPKSPYAAAKVQGESLMRVYAHCFNLSTISLRFFNIFGPRQRADSAYAAVIPRFACAMHSGSPITVYGDGTQTRDFTFVDNAVYALLLAATTGEPLTGQVTNVACGANFSLIHLIKAMGDILDCTPSIEHAPPRPGEVQNSLASIEQAQHLLGYEPIVKFDEGLERTVRTIIQEPLL